MKKILAIVLALALCFACVACTASSDETTTASSDESTSAADLGDKVFNIGVCQLVQHVALDAATQGFQEKLTELLGEDHVKFDVQNASGDSATCATIVNQFVSSDVDLILANATAALTSATAATKDIPILGTSITDYATALEISDWTGTTGINVSGTSDCAPLDQQAAMFSELLPVADYPTVGLLYCSAEANSKYQCDEVGAALKEAGYEVTEYTFADSNDISAVLDKLVTEVSAVYIPTDNTAANNTELINNKLEAAKIPAIAGEEGICEGCGIATLSISYYDLGVATAEMAYDILVNGADVSTMEIQYVAADTLTKEYMADRAKSLGITIPDGYTAIEVEDAE